MAFVRVSGYGQEEIDNARREGMVQFVDNAVCGNSDAVITHEGVEVPLNTQSGIFTNKTFSDDGFIVFSFTSSDSTPSSNHPWLGVNVTTISGQCQQMTTKYCAYYPQSYEVAGNVFIYKVRAGSQLSATVYSRDRKMRVTGGYYYIHTPAGA